MASHRCPSLLGQRSTHGGIVVALEGGGSGAYDSSAAEAQVERARPRVARARRLSAVWARLDGPTRHLLEAHYQPLRDPGPGVRALLGIFAAAALHATQDRHGLKLACSRGTLETNQATLRRELGRAERTVAVAREVGNGGRALEPGELGAHS